MFDSVFKIIYLILFVVIALVRRVFTSKYRLLELSINNKTSIDIILLTLNGIAMILPLIYIFSRWFEFANFSLPEWFSWIGTVVFILAIYMLYQSHKDLGSNWTMTIGIRNKHQLITEGIFKYIRHPMYAAHIYWALATLLILTNWFAAIPFVFTTIAQYLIRYKNEEQMMINEFGEDYENYMKTTGRILPKLKN